MKQQLKKINEFFLDILFPIKCLVCNKDGEWICDDCFSEIEIESKNKCPKCLKENNDGSFCKKCQVTSKMSGIVVSASYENKLLQKAVHILKYKYVKGLSLPLAKILKEGFNSWTKNHNCKFDNIVLIPVPLHKKKEKLRGFNQAELLANDIGKLCKIKVDSRAISRIKNTSAQAKLDLIKRRKNIKNAFKINKKQNLKGKTVFIVDDVCTTKSTLEECAKEIIKANPESIWGLVLARGK